MEMDDFEKSQDELVKTKAKLLDELNKMVSCLADKSDGFVSWQLTMLGIVVSGVWAIGNALSNGLKVMNIMVLVLALVAFGFLQLMVLYAKKIRNSIELIAGARNKIMSSSSVEEAYNGYVDFVGTYRHPFRDMPSCICDLICKKRS